MGNLNMSENNAVERLIGRIANSACGDVRIMEVCGTHTMSIAKSGIKGMLPGNIRLISGPGCPVCVTPGEIIDQVLKLVRRQDVTIATYGDMVRVPGTERGESLQTLSMAGADVQIVYSPMDAVELARNSKKQVVFLGVGFETTSPGTAVAVKVAHETGVGNFSVLSLLKKVEPALRALLADEDAGISAFLCPGHVATIIGEKGFRFLPEEYGKPSVISGFEPEDILVSVSRIIGQLEAGTPKLENEYTRAVMLEGNVAACRIIDEVFEPGASLWRGLGVIPKSGLVIRDYLSAHDAAKIFKINMLPPEKPSACRCGEVIKGKMEPSKCPLFGNICTPENPSGPCMVSSEGSCAAMYKYGNF